MSGKQKQDFIASICALHEILKVYYREKENDPRWKYKNWRGNQEECGR